MTWDFTSENHHHDNCLGSVQQTNLVSGEWRWKLAIRTAVSLSYDHAILDKKKGHYWDPDAPSIATSFLSTVG